VTTTAGGAKLEAQTPLGAMSEEQLKAFLEAAKADAELQEQLPALQCVDGIAYKADAVVAIAKAAGFVISAEELGEEEIEELERLGISADTDVRAW